MPNINKENCIFDCRISSTKQQSGGGLGDQELICQNLANRKDWNVLKIFSKIYSGRAEERMDFEEILDFVKDQIKKGVKVDYYVVKSIDRFTRDGAVTFTEMKDRLTLLGVTLVDTWGMIQPEQNTLEHLGFEYNWSKRSPTATAQLMEAQRAKDEVTDILTRMVGAEIRLVQEGYKIRPPNDGFINHRIMVEGKKKMIEIPDIERAHFFRKMFELRAMGTYTDQEIVDQINAIGYKTKIQNRWSKDKNEIIALEGGKPLTIKRLQTVIQRPIYAGVKVEKWTNYKPILAKYDGLVSIKTYNEANRGKIFIKECNDGTLQLLHDCMPHGKEKPKRFKYNPDFRYKFLPCSICGKWMLGSYNRGKLGTRYPAYHCGGATNGIRSHAFIRYPKEEYEKAIKDFIKALKFTDIMLESFEKILIDVYRTREKEVLNQSSMISNNVGSLKAQQASVIDILTVTQSSIARKKLEDKIDKLEKQIEVTENQRNKIEISEKDIKSFIRSVKIIMEHPSKILLDTDDMLIQQVLFGLVFDEIPTYLEILNGTPKLSLAFKLSKDFNVNKNRSVTLPGIEPGLPA